MAYQGFRNTYESIPNVSTNKYKASQTQDDGGYGSLGQPPIPTPSFNLPENHKPWPNNAEDPFQLLRCSQNSTRNLSDATDCDSVADLDGLVSNILEDGDSSDPLSHTKRNSSKFTSIWSPQTIGNDLLHYSQSASTEANPDFDQVQGPVISKEINNSFQQFYGFNTSNQRLSKSSNGDMDGYKPHSLKPTKPQCLPIPSMENGFLSAMRESQLIGKNFPIQKKAFGHQGEMDSRLVNDYNDKYIQSSPEQYQQSSPQDVNKLVSPFIDLMATKKIMVEENNHFKLTNSAMSPDSALRTPVKRGLGGDIGPVQRNPNEGFMLHAFQDNYRFQGHDTKHIQQSTSNSAPCNPIKSYQSNIITQSLTATPNVNQVLNQYSQDQMQQSQLTNMASRDRGYLPFNQHQPVSEFGPGTFPPNQRSPFYKQDLSRGDGRNVHHVPGQSQLGMSTEPLRKADVDAGLRGEKSRLHSTAGAFVQDGFLSTQRTECNTRVPRHGLPQRNNFYFPQSGNTYGSQRFGVGNSTADTGKLPQFVPHTYPVSDPRPSSFKMGVNSNSNLSSRPSQPYGSGPPCRDLCDRRPEGEFAALKPDIAFQMAQSAGGGMYPDMASTKSPQPMTKNRGGPMSQLHYYLEECCDQLACLEKERKKFVILNKTFAGRRANVATSSLLPKMPPNPSRVDRLIVDQIREHSRVLSLLDQLDPLSSLPFQGYIHSTLDRHYKAIISTQTRRREECINLTGQQKQGSTQDIMPLAMALKDLCSATRKTRTALWCTLQATVPMSAGVLDIHGDAETPAVTEESIPARRL
ncbi:meiosis-specific coiled-coil domain-containing protein MEIOC [Gadus morhua]|uniref:Meiosis-specific coiled-coil domain-containing protein MEIOC n=1 Tax=Gadus morhua TaxID=8049 RepID=A0A8C5ASU0_GADMO|nr:meiosis-specific coiled-coil domain-containing protein MEIOC [Gadus morhua]